MTADHSPRQIDLAQEPAFSLGLLEVRPATLEVIAGERREQLEPRIMQVLVALARQRGEVVSRDMLIATCWDGRVVGDDSINRCISRLRKLAEDLGGFAIDTVPRVGFRLTESGRRALNGTRRLARPWVLLGVAVAVVILVAGVWAWRAAQTASEPMEPRVAVTTFQVLDEDPASRLLAAKLADDIRGVLDEHLAGVGVAGAAATQAELMLGGTVSRDGDTWRVRATLIQRRGGAVLWSGRFDRPSAEQDQLRDQVAVAAVETVFTARDGFQQPGLKVDPQTLALYIKAGELQKTNNLLQPGDARRGLEEVIARSPHFAAARGSFAGSLLGPASRAPPAEANAIIARIRREAARALKDDPRDGAAYDALYGAQRFEKRTDVADAEDVLLAGLARSPRTPWADMRECRLLVEVGRANAAVPYCERGLALRPMGSPLGHSYVRALNAAGRRDLARTNMERYARFHPDNYPTRSLRFEMAMADGAFDEALRLLHSPATRPQVFTDAAVAALESLVTALRSRRLDDATTAMEALHSAAARRELDPRYVIIGATQLGRLDDAFAALAPLGPRSFIDGVLFLPETAALRRDPRFWPLANRLGYVRYWRARNAWPDFCSDPAFGVDCKAAAARVAGPG